MLAICSLYIKLAIYVYRYVNGYIDLFHLRPVFCVFVGVGGDGGDTG